MQIVLLSQTRDIYSGINPSVSVINDHSSLQMEIHEMAFFVCIDMENADFIRLHLLFLRQLTLLTTYLWKTIKSNFTDFSFTLKRTAEMADLTYRYVKTPEIFAILRPF